MMANIGILQCFYMVRLLLFLLPRTHVNVFVLRLFAIKRKSDCAWEHSDLQPPSQTANSLIRQLGSGQSASLVPRKR